MGRSIATKNWDLAIITCKKAIIHIPEDKKYWELDLEACNLSKNNKPYEALEIWLKRYTLNYRDSYTLHSYANKFAEIGAHDRAWGLYNEATGLAWSEGRSLHLIRESMADLLFKENKPFSAAENLIIGIEEAEKLNNNGTPKSTMTKLKKALKMAGFSEPLLADQLYMICKKQGHEKAIAYLKSQKV